MKTKLIILLAIITLGCSKEEEYEKYDCITVTVEGVNYKVRNFEGFDIEEFEEKASPEQASIMQEKGNCN